MTEFPKNVVTVLGDTRLMYGLSERGKDFKLENVKGREIPVTRRKVMETPLTADRQVYLSAAVC